MRTLLRLFSVLLLLGLFAGACSSDPEPSAETADTDADGDNDPDGDGDGDDGDLTVAYCAMAEQAGELAGGFDPIAATPAEVEEFYETLLALIDSAGDEAPEAVGASLEVQRQATIDTIAVLEPLGWNYIAALDELTPIYTAAEYGAASEVLDEFDVDVCGFEPLEITPGDTPPVEPPPVDEPVAVPPEHVDYCDASFAASQAEDLPFDAGPTEGEAYYRGLVGALDRMLELAPPELEAALSTIRTNFAEVIEIMESVEWELDAGFPLVEEWASDPAVTDPMDAAIVLVEDFDANVCGIAY